ncbi:hypothetical protein [Hugenholtzia roseola]|uniref:hypothetical protein n=1 Tax=Hugenholtzia roseola TaxID=1002 RepID=UPI0003FDC607|nr:hypothetical protein [Hugenholtzia roseola]
MDKNKKTLDELANSAKSISDAEAKSIIGGNGDAGDQPYDPSQTGDSGTMDDDTWQADPSFRQGQGGGGDTTTGGK